MSSPAPALEAPPARSVLHVPTSDPCRMVLERCDLRSLRRLHGVNVALKDAVEQCVESRAWREAEHLFAVPSTTDSTSSEAWRKVFQVSGGLPGPGRPSPFMVFCQERRREIIRTNPSMGFRDIGRALGAAWAGFSDEQKRSYCVGLSSAGEAQRKCSGARQLSFLNAYHTLVADAKRVARAERWTAWALSGEGTFQLFKAKGIRFVARATKRRAPVRKALLRWTDLADPFLPRARPNRGHTLGGRPRLLGGRPGLFYHFYESSFSHAAKSKEACQGAHCRPALSAFSPFGIVLAAVVMFAAKKIVKEKDVPPEPFEMDVAQALCDLEANSNDLKAELRELYIVSAKEVD
ncbi:hypothetical protein EMIHUDRAFT_252069, partial [Emiliania huxleyi CCMP1516]|uniref:HMG box domain-containing protein n=2 Tax=Emiliania huxleyi TaxID=2903 RepID=A0A0D3KNY0_EMIH1